MIPTRTLIPIAVIATAGLACTPARRGPDHAQGTPVESRHWVHDLRLREIMSELDELQLSTWPQELQAEYASAEAYSAAKAFWEARRLAEGLALAAKKMPATVRHIDMIEADRRSFLAQVDVLREQALELERVTSLGDRDGMRRALASIDETCISCHDRFRDFSGPLGDR